MNEDQCDKSYNGSLDTKGSALTQAQDRGSDQEQVWRLESELSWVVHRHRTLPIPWILGSRNTSLKLMGKDRKVSKSSLQIRCANGRAVEETLCTQDPELIQTRDLLMHMSS